MSDALERCPFCGHDCLTVKVDDEEWDAARVSCQASGCYALGPYVDIINTDPDPDSDGPTAEDKDTARRKAITAWNTRTSEGRLS